MFKTIIITLFWVLTLSSCSMLSGPDENENKSKSYTEGNISGWATIDPDKYDSAYVNKKTNSILLTNSLCKKYTSSTLESLLENILSGIDNISITKKDVVKYNSRDALSAEATGEMDGIKVYLLVQTFKKNRCIYDFILISNSFKSRNKDRMDFTNLINTTRID